MIIDDLDGDTGPERGGPGAVEPRERHQPHLIAGIHVEDGGGDPR